MKCAYKFFISIVLILISANPTFADLPSASHGCENQDSSSIVVDFQIPRPNPSIYLHRVRLVFSFSDLENTMDAEDFTLAPYAEIPEGEAFSDRYNAFQFSAFASDVEISIPGNANLGYIMSITESGNSYILEIKNKQDTIGNFGYWENPPPDTEEWSLTINDITDTDGYEFSIDGMYAYTTNSDSDAIPLPAGLECTMVTPCNQPPTAVVNINEAGSDEYLANEDIIFLMHPAIITLDGGFNDEDGYEDDMDSPIYSWTVDDGVTETGNSSHLHLETGIYTVSLTVTDDFGVTSTEATKIINVIPSDVVTFPGARGLPYDDGKEPYIDGKLSGIDDQAEPAGTSDEGIIYGENGWRGAHMFTFNNGSDLDGTAMFLRSRDDNFLMLGFEINSDTTPVSDDLLVLGFRDGADDRITNTSPTHQAKLIYIEPVEEGTGNVVDQLEAEIQIFEKTGNGDWIPIVISEQDLVNDGWDIGVEGLSGETWSMEIKIPLSGNGLEGLDDDFLFFFDVFKSQTGGSVEPVRWPRKVPDITATIGTETTDIVTHVNSIAQFDPMWWGIANRSDALTANGLSLPHASYVGVRENPGDTILSSSIRKNEDNVLVARILNTSQKTTFHDFGSGNVKAIQTLPVNEVTATFKIANWGIPPGDLNYWPEIGTTTHVTIDAPHTGSGTGGYFYNRSLDPPEAVPDDFVQEVEITWNPTDFDVQQKHQCIHVELSAPNQADIVTRSVHRNMNFDAINDGPSIFIHPSEISALGYGLPPADDEEHKILLRIFTKTWNYTKEEVGAIKGNPKHRIENEKPYYLETLPFIMTGDNQIHFIEYLVKGYLYTGNQIVVRGEERELVEPIGSYGHIVRHRGPVEKWIFHIEGAEKINDTTYLIRIPPGERKTIIDHVRAVKPPEPPKWRIHAHGGAAFPINALAAGNTVGPNFIVGAGYHLFPELGLNLLFGYNYLFPRPAGGTGTHLMSTVLQIRVCKELFTKVSFYAGIGPGLYFDTAGRFDAGLNVGLGFSFLLSRSLELEIGGDSHLMFPAKDIYLHAHTGAVVRF
jgi:PKD repeat protein